MNFEEMLKGLGYTEEQVKAIVGEMKKQKIYLSNEENADVRLTKLQEDFSSKDKELTTANELVKSLQEAAKANDIDGMKTKITDYEATIAQLQEEVKTGKIQSQLNLALKDAGATDVDYIAYKIREKLKGDDKELELDSNEKIKGLSEMIENEKKLSPSFFKTESKKEVQVKELGESKENNNEGEPKNFKEAVTQFYESKNQEI